MSDRGNGGHEAREHLELIRTNDELGFEAARSEEEIGDGRTGSGPLKSDSGQSAARTMFDAGLDSVAKSGQVADQRLGVGVVKDPDGQVSVSRPVT